jgi:methylmalonyl-CoA mutase N-terminal domain/subunit
VGDVGKAGVAIDTVEDMKVLFDQIVRNVSFNDHERCCTAHNGFFILLLQKSKALNQNNFLGRFKMIF